MYLGRCGGIRAACSNYSPRRKHPYTQALLRAVPTILAAPRQRLETIGGAVPHPGARPAGCAFHPRCADFMPGRCDAGAPPPLMPGAAGASCFLEVPA
jgi:oligopeptide/dipeptide ABC transporter ATP-binding protein